MFTRCRSRDRRQGGKPCPGTGARTGRATPISTDRASRLKSPPVTEESSQTTTWRLPVGSSVKPSKVANFKLNRTGKKLVKVRLKRLLNYVAVGEGGCDAEVSACDWRPLTGTKKMYT
ncbi:hypothetical protein QQ045_002980 [Rhodiola kirilowii]